MTYYGWFMLENKSVRIEQTVKKLFPVIIVSLILLEVFFTLEPTVNVRGSKYAQVCYLKACSDLCNSLRKTQQCRPKFYAA